MKKTIFILILLLIPINYGMSQVNPSEQSKEIVQNVEFGAPTTEVAPQGQLVTEGEFRKLQQIQKTYLLVAIIAATPIMLFLVLFFIKKSPHHTPENLVNVSALVLVIQATTFISVYAPTSEQLTAPIGILGAIAGYLFGQYKKREEVEAEVGSRPPKG